jgi:hypothetical protein
LSLNCDVIAPGTDFRNVYILESRNAWRDALPSYDRANDLVLTYDFGLRQEIEAIGGSVRYVDHLCDPSVMQENNFLMYQFFRDWHLDANGADIFRYRDVDFGFSFRIEIWNDFTFYVRSRLCLEELRGLRYRALYVGADLELLEEVLRDMGMVFSPLPNGDSSAPAPAAYFFPVHRWMNERLRSRRLRHVIRDIVVTVQGIAMSWYDRMADCFCTRTRVFVQEYHPTRKLLLRLQKHPGFRVMQVHFSATTGLLKYLRDRPIPIYGNLKKYQIPALGLIETLRQRRSARLILSNGIDITDAVNRMIERKVIEVLPESLRALDCVIRYLDRHPIRLEVLIANVGQVAMIVDCVAKSRGVPSYMIINGLMGNAYLDEAKYATVINGYSQSIRENYFRGMQNVICLGDPRMDQYARCPPRAINRERPTVTIGASGFNNIDLNSYLAVEFKFLSDILTALRDFKQAGRFRRVVLKTRANGYRESYHRFVGEYFPGLVDEIIDGTPMNRVLDKTDLFVSLHSQTLFEASCLGIPCIYHKNDLEILDPPFNGRSELVTTYDVTDLMQAFHDFLESSDRFDAFLNKSVMEKYVGPLDGKNLKRNLDFVLELLGKNR